jgi:hypothetical protein
LTGPLRWGSSSDFMEQLRALSVRQPWAHSIVHHGKDVENRTRSLGHRGWTLIHASACMTDEDLNVATRFMRAGRLPLPPAVPDLALGGIVGVARIIDCVDQSASPWWIGPYGLVIDRAHALPFTRCKGTVAPLFWRPPADVLDALRPALQALDLAP